MEVSILDLRKNMSKVLKALEMNETVKLTYRGKDKGVIIPVGQAQKKDLTKCKAFGMWADRKDIFK